MAAREPYRSRAHEGARRKGREAHAAGLGRDQNPYPDLRTTNGRNITFSRSFALAWDLGWAEAAAAAEEAAS